VKIVDPHADSISGQSQLCRGPGWYREQFVDRMDNVGQALPELSRAAPQRAPQWMHVATPTLIPRGAEERISRFAKSMALRSTIPTPCV
jgi:hypothetical protein